MKIVEPSATLLWATPASEEMIELAGRTCYKSEPRTYSDCSECKGSGKVPAYKDQFNDKYNTPEHECDYCKKRSTKEFITKILKSGHHSVLEHGSASLRIVCDRGISHEIVRHRIASYSQESSRYCNYSSDKFGKEIIIIKPYSLRETLTPEEYKEKGYKPTFNVYTNPNFITWLDTMQHCELTYLELLEKGISPQIARSVLPTGLKTEIVMTTNFRSWRNFLKLRLDKAAHPDMIVVAEKIRDILIQVAPTVFGEFK